MGANQRAIPRSKSENLAGANLSPAILQSYPNTKATLKRIKPVIVDEESIVQ